MRLLSFLKNPEGFYDVISQKNVNKLRAEIKVDFETSSMSEEYVKSELIRKLVKGLINNSLVNIYTSKDTDGITTYAAEINAVHTGTSYVNLEDKQFTVEGENFTNEDLVEAVKKCFPERFV